MRTVAFLNQKGGVGKTSLCFHLSAALAARVGGCCWWTMTRKGRSRKGSGGARERLQRMAGRNIASSIAGGEPTPVAAGNPADPTAR